MVAPLLSRIQERPWLIAVGLSLVVALWLASGQFGQAQTPPETPAPALDETALMQVQVRQSQAQMLPLDREIRGRTEPWAAAELAAETEGRVVAVLREPGEMVQPGEIILKIDPRARAEVLEQARALSSQREAEFAAASRLHRQGHLTDTQLAQSRAALAGARAEEQRAQLDLDAATVRSPIAGRIEARPAQVGDYLKVGTVVAHIATLNRLKLVSYVSELLVEELATAQKVQIDGRNGHPTQEGTVHFVAHTADAATRTYRVEIALPNPDGRPAGESVRGRIRTGQMAAHKLPISLIDLSDDGSLAILGLEAGQDVVARYPTRILRTEAEQAWLGDLPENLRVITRGQGFVQPGDRVDVRLNEG